MTAVDITTMILIAGLIGVAVWQLQPHTPEQTQSEQLAERLSSAGFNSEMFMDDLEIMELQRPFSERVLTPLVERLGRLMMRRTKQAQLQALRMQLHRAGSKKKPEALLAQQVITPFVLAGAGLALTALTNQSAQIIVLSAIGGAVLGYMQPTSSLKGKTKKRAQEIRLGLPGVLDLLTVCMEAGLSLDMALMRVSQSDEGALGQEFKKVIDETRLGRPRMEALAAMAERNDVEELTSFIRAVMQAEPLGVGVATVLTIQSEELRQIRRQRAEEAGHRAPVLMLLPMMGCIFPCIFIILLGPAVLKIVSGQ